MKDFEKTNEFIRNANAFSDLTAEFCHDLNDAKRMPVDSTIDRLRDLNKMTRLKGEELAKEVLEVCPDMKDLQWYYDEWVKRLEQIDTGFVIADTDFNSSYWAYMLDDDNKGLALGSIIRAMNSNYDDVMNGKRLLAKRYSLTTKEDKELAEDLAEHKKINNKKDDRPKKSHSFRDLIQYPDPDALLERLHFLIDGKKRPMDIGLVICNAVHCMNYLKREPGQKEFYSEFPNAWKKWTSIYNYFHMYDDPEDKKKEKHDQDLSERASQIVIFD